MHKSIWSTINSSILKSDAVLVHGPVGPNSHCTTKGREEYSLSWVRGLDILRLDCNCPSLSLCPAFFSCFEMFLKIFCMEKIELFLVELCDLQEPFLLSSVSLPLCPLPCSLIVYEQCDSIYLSTQNLNTSNIQCDLLCHHCCTIFLWKLLTSPISLLKCKNEVFCFALSFKYFPFFKTEK